MLVIYLHFDCDPRREVYQKYVELHSWTTMSERSSKLLGLNLALERDIVITVTLYRCQTYFLLSRMSA